MEHSNPLSGSPANLKGNPDGIDFIVDKHFWHLLANPSDDDAVGAPVILS